MRTAHLTVLAVVLTPWALRAQDIQSTLDKAKSAFELEVQSIRTEAATIFEEQRNAARKKGDTKEMDRLAGAKGWFNTHLQLPHETPYRPLSGRIYTARSALATAYKVASAEYGKANKPAKADDVLNELAHLQEAWDSVQVGSIWVGNWVRFQTDDGKATYKATVTVTERRGSHFKADVEFEPVRTGDPVPAKWVLLGDILIDQVKAQNGGKYLKYTGSVTVRSMTLTYGGFNPKNKKEINGSAELTLKHDPRRK